MILPAHRSLAPARRLVLLVAMTPALAAAQRADTREEAGEGDPVALVARPLVGDTLHLVTEQIIEAGVMREAGAEGRLKLPDPVGTGRERGGPPRAAARDAGPRRGANPPRVTRMRFHARSIVEGASDSGTVLRSVPDSMLLATAGAPPRRMTFGGLAALRLFVRPDGAMRVVDASTTAAPVGATLSGMPAMLPTVPVRVGGTWTRDVPMPPLPYTSYRADGVLHARFRLDSLSRDGRMAWVSIDGTLRRDGAGRALKPGTRVVTAGTITGWLVLDRAVGWITDARTVIAVTSDIVGAGEDDTPMHATVRITQRMRVR